VLRVFDTTLVLLDIAASRTNRQAADLLELIVRETATRAA